jgi:hypothetical protein
VAGVGSDQRLHAYDADTGAVIYAGGGNKELMTGTRQWNTGIAARGRIYFGADNKIYAFTLPAGTATPTPTASATVTPTATVRAMATSTPTPTPMATAYCQSDSYIQTNAYPQPAPTPRPRPTPASGT